MLNKIDVIVPDPTRTAQFLRDALDLEVLDIGERYAELRSGAMIIMLSPEAMVPMKNAAGVILHFQVQDVPQAFEKACRAGAKVLMKPTKTEWSSLSSLIEGPDEGVVIDLYCEL